MNKKLLLCLVGILYIHNSCAMMRPVSTKKFPSIAGVGSNRMLANTTNTMKFPCTFDASNGNKGDDYSSNIPDVTDVFENNKFLISKFMTTPELELRAQRWEFQVPKERVDWEHEILCTARSNNAIAEQQIGELAAMIKPLSRGCLGITGGIFLAGYCFDHVLLATILNIPISMTCIKELEHLWKRKIAFEKIKEETDRVIVNSRN